MNPIERTHAPPAELPPEDAGPEAVEEAIVHPLSTGEVEPGGATEDARLVEDANRLLASLVADPMMAIELAQSWIRDLSLEVREDSALSAQERAEVSERLAQAAQELERAARAAAAESNTIGQVFGWIGAVLAAVVSAVASVFTGGASLALGIAAIACMAAAQTITVLAQEGIIDNPDVAMGLSIGFSVAATILSLGAAAIGGGAQAATTAGTKAAQVAAEAAMKLAQQAVELAKNILNIVNVTVEVASGVNQIVGTVFTHDADLAEIDGDRNELRADDARAEVSEHTDAFGTTMRLFRRMAERMASIREAKGASLSAAMIRA